MAVTKKTNTETTQKTNFADLTTYIYFMAEKA